MKRNPRRIEDMVTHQIRQWTLEKDRRSEPTPSPARQRVITISREFGALGAELGRMVAERLGYAFWDRELVKAVAERNEMSAAVAASMDETRRSAISRMVDDFVSGVPVSEAVYVRELAQLVQTIAEHGRAVIVGRGAGFILGPSRALRVRVVQSFESRVADLARRHGWQNADARETVLRKDAERRIYIKRHYDCDISDVYQYDVIINVDVLELERAADVVVAALGR